MQLENDKYSFFHPNSQVRTHASIAAVQHIQFSVLTDENRLKEIYKDKLSVLYEYPINIDIEKTRQMTFLDSNRDKFYVDDILVHLIKADYQVEACWVRLESLKTHSFIGRLRNEPYQALGVHLGDLLEFRVEKNTDNKYICCCYL